MIREFGSNGRSPIYDPAEFQKFCIESGATTIFQNLVSAVCTDRQQDRRHEANKRLIVSTIYKLCFALSQRCNYLQQDNTLFMMFNNLNKEAMCVERTLGTCCSTRTSYRMLQRAESAHVQHINAAIQTAIDNEWFIVATIDDYTNINTHRRPLTEKVSSAVNMCTVVVSIFKDIPALPWQHASELHNPEVVNDEFFIRTIVGIDNMHKLSMTYATLMPEWLTDSFFHPRLTRQRLNAHEYYQSENVQQLRSFDNLYLVEFRELPLKSRQAFETATGWLLDTVLESYLQRFCVLLPGDHPAQFYSRQAIYSKSFGSIDKGSFQQDNTSIENNENNPSFHDHGDLYKHHIPLSGTTAVPFLPRHPIQGLIPMIGPLHIGLNAQEDVMVVYHSFFKYVYEGIFTSSKLADNPKTWRVSLIFEIVYGGWLEIRSAVLETFQFCKSTELSWLLILLDNYLPLVLSIYSVTFKLNKFSEYKNAMVRVWTMFLCFKRKNYNKTPLIWLSQMEYWQKNNMKLFQLYSNNLAGIDEYRVENTHSIIRGNTNKQDTPEALSKKAKALFASKRTLHNFKSSFATPKNYTFSCNQLESLKVSAAKVLTGIFSFLSDKPDSETKIPEFLSADRMIDVRMLPLGFHCQRKPNPAYACDFPGCTNREDPIDWLIMRGCNHSFHKG